MIQFLFHEDQEKHLVKYHQKKNIELTIDLKLLKKLKNFYKLTVFNFIEVKQMSNFFIFNFKNTSFTFENIFLIKNFCYII